MTNAASKPKEDFLSMSDDDFNEQMPPSKEEAVVVENSDDIDKSEEEDIVEDVDSKESANDDDTDTTNDVKEDESTTEETVVDEDPDDDKFIENKPSEVKPKDDDKPIVDDKPEDKAEDKSDKPVEVEETPSLNYAAIGELVMKPFKANGKMINLKDPEEAISLMQMGANYTRKMQDILPHRKILTMLEKNELLDEEKLSFYVDLSKKDPEAIKKFLKDSNIDPIDIDISEEPNYQAGNNEVSDEEVNFNSVLEDLTSMDNGKETLGAINDWDTVSKEAIWDNPEIMTIIHEQKQSGIYERITSEVDRLKILGKIPANTPFLTAYNQVGNQLSTSGGFDDLVNGTNEDVSNTNTNVAPKEKRVLETRSATPKNKADINDGAEAAALSRGRPTKAKPLVNPLAESDEEFMKKFAGRV